MWVYIYTVYQRRNDEQAQTESADLFLFYSFQRGFTMKICEKCFYRLGWRCVYDPIFIFFICLKPGGKFAGNVCGNIVRLQILCCPDDE